MHDDVTLPKGSMVVVVTLKSKMAASSASSGGNSKSTQYLTYLKAQTNPPSRYSTALPRQNTLQYFCHLNFPLRKIQRLIGFVRHYNYHNAPSSRKSIVYVIMHQVYSTGTIFSDFPWSLESVPLVEEAQRLWT